MCHQRINKSNLEKTRTETFLGRKNVRHRKIRNYFVGGHVTSAKLKWLHDEFRL